MLWIFTRFLYSGCYGIKGLSNMWELWEFQLTVSWWFFAWLCGVPLMYVQLNIQQSDQEDLYSDIWNSFSVFILSFQDSTLQIPDTSAPQNPIFFSLTQKEHCTLPGFPFPYGDSESSSRQKPRAIIDFTSFVSFSFFQRSQFCTACFLMSKKNRFINFVQFSRFF